MEERLFNPYTQDTLNLIDRLNQLERRVETNSHLLHLTEEMNTLKIQEKRNLEQLEETKFSELEKRIAILE